MSVHNVNLDNAARSKNTVMLTIFFNTVPVPVYGIF